MKLGENSTLIRSACAAAMPCSASLTTLSVALMSFFMGAFISRMPLEGLVGHAVDHFLMLAVRGVHAIRARLRIAARAVGLHQRGADRQVVRKRAEQSTDNRGHHRHDPDH